MVVQCQTQEIPHCIWDDVSEVRADTDIAEWLHVR